MNRIKFYRSQAKLTQKQLSRECGWGNAQSRIANYEKGYRSPSIEDVRKIAVVLSQHGVIVSIDDIFPPKHSK